MHQDTIKFNEAKWPWPCYSKFLPSEKENFFEYKVYIKLLNK